MAPEHRLPADALPGEECAPVERALEQSQEVKAKVEECAEDISASNAVVRSSIAQGATVLSAQDALAKGSDVEGKVQECADDLHEITETLAKGVEDLKQTEAALSQSRAELARSQAALATSREAEQEARQRSLRDSTTGLPNRDLFDARLEQALSMAARHHWTLAVMFLDLDRFKDINDVHGHSAGDVVLREVADRLSRQARAEDTVCRNGGDEFLYLLVNPRGRANIERIARGLVDRISQPIPMGTSSVRVGVSIGIAVHSQAPGSGEQLIRQADAAMYAAKRSGTRCAFAEAEPEAVNALERSPLS